MYSLAWMAGQCFWLEICANDVVVLYFLSLHIVSASADDDPRLLVLLSVVDLLAACCKGRNVFVQSICQTIVSSDELLQV